MNCAAEQAGEKEDHRVDDQQPLHAGGEVIAEEGSPIRVPGLCHGGSLEFRISERRRSTDRECRCGRLRCCGVAALAVAIQCARAHLQRHGRAQPDLPVGENAGGDGETVGPVEIGRNAPDRQDGRRPAPRAAEGRPERAPAVCLFAASCPAWSPCRNESEPPWGCDTNLTAFAIDYTFGTSEPLMQKFKTALFGTGFVGRVHLEGIRRLGYVELYAIGEPQIEKAKQLAAEFGVRADRGGLSPHPGRSGRRCRSHLHAQRAAFPHREGRAAGGQARDLRKAAGHQHRRGPGTGRTSPRRRSCATAPRTTCASTRWCSTCAAWWKTATWATSWCCRAPIRRTGCSTIPTGTGASTASSTAPRAAWPISARTGATWRSTSPDSASPASARHGDLPQDPQAAQGPDRDLRRQDAFAGGLHRDRRSIPRTWARWCSAWATARAAPTPPAR